MKLKFLLLTIMTILVSACTENNPDDIINLEEITPGDGKIVDNPLSGEICSSNEILYISTTESVIDFSFENLIENTYQNGVGRLRFSDNVTMISTNGFQGKNIKFIKLPNDVSIIEGRAFAGCPLLQGISVGNKLKQIGVDAFRGCTMMKRVDINDLSSWCEIIFTNSSSNPLHIGARLYLNEDEVKSLSFPANIQELKPYTFANCISLENVTIGNNVTEIGDYAFAYCKSLENVTIGNNVTEIGDYAFANCISLMDVSIGKNVSLIAPYAFSECKALKSIIIPDSVTEIGDGAFYHCSSLTRVNITDIAAWCGINFNFGYSGSNPISCAHNLYLNGELVTDLVIPDNVTEIGDYAFMNCTSLTSVIIPDSVTEIGDGAFSNCTSLINITIPDSVTTIGGWAFVGCRSLTSITIPDSVTTIGDLAFRDCSSLTSITIPDSVTTIGDSAFKDCTGELIINSKIVETDYFSSPKWLNGAKFTKLVIGDNITSIGDRAFRDCSSMCKVIIGSGVRSVGYSAFENCYFLNEIICKPTTPPTAVRHYSGVWNAFNAIGTSAKIYVPMESVNTYKTAKGWRDYADIIVGIPN